MNNLRIINIDMVIIKHINIDMDICENIGIDMKFLEHINKKTKARTSGDCKCKDGVTGSICWSRGSSKQSPHSPTL